MPSSKRDAWVGVGLAVAIVCVYALTLREGHAWGDDFALYILHARNIAAGLPYADTGYIPNPHVPLLSPAAYPPVFPILLSPLYAATGLDLAPMKLLVIGCFGAFLVCLFLMARRGLSYPGSLALVAMIGANPLFWEYKDQVLSDFPFLMLAFGLFALTGRAESAEPGRPWLYGLLVGSLIYLAYGTRSLGLLLAPALAARDLLQARRLRRSTLVALGLFAALALLQKRLLPEAGSYAGQFPTTLGFLPGNAAMYGWSFSMIWESGFGRPIRLAVSAAVAALAALGYVVRFRKRPGVPELFLPLYLAPLLVWPGRIDRYLMPAIVLLLLHAVQAVEFLGGSFTLRGRRAKTIAAALLACVAVLYAGRYARLPRGPIADGVEGTEARALFSFVREHTAERSVFVFRKPRALALYTGRRALIYHEAPDNELGDWLDAAGATHYIVAAGDPPWWRDFVGRRQSQLRVLYDGGSFRVLGRAPGRACRSGSAPSRSPAG